METSLGVKMASLANKGFCEILNRFAEIFNARVFNPLFHIDFIYGLTNMGKEYYKTVKYMNDTCNKIIQERIKKRAVNKQDGAQADRVKARPFLDLLLDLHFDSNNKEFSS